MHNVLLLNNDYSPIKVVDWRRAVSLILRDVVEIVEEYNDPDLRLVSMAFRYPSILRLKRFINLFNRNVKFSKTAIFNRDHYTCQYCGDKPNIKSLTFDHVIPRSKDGKTDWFNVVTACRKCNTKKANKTPEEAHMPLRRKPYKPDNAAYIKFTLAIPKTPEGWSAYLSGWNRKE